MTANLNEPIKASGLINVLASNGFMEAQYNCASKILLVYCKGIPVHEKIVSGWELIMKFAEKEPIELIFSNGTAVKGTFTKSNDFLKNIVTPFFNQRDLKYFATIINADVFTLFGINQLLKLLNNNFEMKIFKTPTEGKAWLESKTLSPISIPELYMRTDKSS